MNIISYIREETLKVKNGKQTMPFLDVCLDFRGSEKRQEFPLNLF
jgi:hypothetical protein